MNELPLKNYLKQREIELTAEVATLSEDILKDGHTHGEENEMKMRKAQAEARLDEIGKALKESGV